MCLLLAFTVAFSTACQGERGLDGITPKLQINPLTNEWQVSYDNGATWINLGVKATGESGKNGTEVLIGMNGNWFIDGVDTGIKAGCDCGNPGGNGGNTGGSGDNTGGGNTGSGDTESTEYTPIVRFAVASDIHIRQNNGMNSKTQLEKLFNGAYQFSFDDETNSGYNKLDGIFVVGDAVNSGIENSWGDEYGDYFSYVNQNTVPGTVARTVMGNHELDAVVKYGVDNGFTDVKGWTDENIAKATERFKTKSGYDSEDAHIEINDYHFIFVSMDKYGSSTGTDYEFVSEGKRTWLKQQLDLALADDATGEKPIFVFQHVHPQNTVEGSSGGDKYVRELLDDYPNVVDFSGHTHRTITDPRSIWQETFTAINTGSMAYLGHPITNHPTYNGKAVQAFDDSGEWYVADEEHAERDGGLFYICEVDANNVMRIFIYDTFSGSVFGSPMIVDSFGDPTGFDYKAYRSNYSLAPKFSTDAQITVTKTLYHDTKITFPQATGKDLINNYRIEIYQAGNLVKSEYRLSGCNYGNAMSDTMNVTLAGLTANTTYTLKVYAVNYWGKESTPLVKEFTTAQAVSTTTPDIASFTFDEGGGIDSLGGTVLKKDEGATAFDSDLNKYVGVYNGRAAHIYWGLSDWYSNMRSSFSVELYVKVTDVPAAGKSYGLATSMESGGFALYYSNPTNGNPNYSFVYNLSNTNYSAKYEGGINEWIHLVGVYDGSSIKLYANGQEVSTATVTGVYRAPSLTAQFFALGADTWTSDRIEYQSKSKIAFCNLYSYPLTGSQISSLYNAI